MFLIGPDCREYRRYRQRRRDRRPTIWLLVALIVAGGLAVHSGGRASWLERLGLDTGAVIFALLALSLGRRGGRAAVERTLNLACAVGSLTMNLLAADLGSPRSVTVWVLPSALYALASDRLIAV